MLVKQVLFLIQLDSLKCSLKTLKTYQYRKRLRNDGKLWLIYLFSGVGNNCIDAMSGPKPFYSCQKN